MPPPRRPQDWKRSMTLTSPRPDAPAPLDGAIAKARTLPEIFAARVAATPDALAYRQFDHGVSTWTDWSWRRIDGEVARWRAALAAEGLPAGSRIATVMGNSVAYVCLDQAALALGLAVVPLHATDNPGNVAYILDDSGASMLVIDSLDYWTRLAPEVAKLTSLLRIVLLAPGGQPGEADGRTTLAASWLATAAANPEAPAAWPDPEALAAIVYTSGTTGRPKGVMLSHRNVVANVLAVLRCVSPDPEDLFLSFLPLSHTFERTGGYYLPIAAGSAVAFARSIAHLPEDMRAIRPTILISVPRIYERAYLRIQEQLAAKGAPARALYALAERVGWRRFLAAQADPPRRPAPADRALWPILDRLVARSIRAPFGGRLKVAVAGGAPMPEAVSRCFLAMGINVMQGYGMTESAPVVSVNRLGRNDPATVGEPIPGVDVRIGDNDELMVRGPNVMMGYWRRPEETARVLDPDGWLHTGDQAWMRAGRIVIKGRIKDIIVTSTGEKISPADLEQAIGADPLFEQVMVIGEARPFIAAIAVLSRASAREEASRLGLSGDLDGALTSEPLRRLALERIKRAVAHFPSYATPRKVVLTLQPWTVGDGLMTPTLKLKRQAIEAAMAREIGGIYAR
jgi:long-chain acyl-CoA synthetase